VIVLLPGSASDYTAWDYNVDLAKHYKMGFFHFSNNNLAIRKACAEGLGKYDPNVAKSEDVDICFRVALHPEWVALREKGNSVRHKARKTFTDFVKQMWGWGYHVGHPYARTGIRGIYLYWISSSEHKIKFDVEIRKFPWLVCVFLTDFLAAHVLFFLAALAAISGQSLLAAGSAAIAVILFWRYLYDDRHTGLGFWQTCQLAFLHYTANVVLIAAGFLGALKHRVVLVSSAIFRPAPDKDRGNRLAQAD
jgi:hypothetical protein